MKKTFKILGIVFGTILLLLISIPLLFQKQIKNILKDEINKSINATVTFDDLNVSFIRNFPNATIVISDFTIVPFAPFENDTLIHSGSIELKTSLSELMSDKPTITSIFIEDAFVNIITNKDGKTNYDIVKESPEETETEPSNFSLDIEKYSLQNFDFRYLDKSSNIDVVIKKINHTGIGKIVNDDMLLTTKSTTNDFTFSMDNVAYLNKVAIDVDAVLGINLKTMTFTFKENKALLNDLDISLDGFLQLVDEGFKMDLKFASKDAQFKSLLSLVPQAYSSNFESVKATGALDLNGKATGMYSDTEIPKFNLTILSKDASFNFPQLPKSVEHIYVNTFIENTTGNIDDTTIALNNLALQIDQDVFQAKGFFSHLTTNPQVNATIKGTLNLGNLSKAYPIKMEQKLQGIIKANITTAFNQQAIEKNNFSEIKSSGNLSLNNFKTSTDLLPNPIHIKNSELQFNTQNFTLSNFEATTGKSDLNIKGTIDNLYGYAFNNKDLKGNFVIKSKLLNVSDLLNAADTVSTAKPATKTTSKKTATTTAAEAIKIPAKIDAKLQMNVGKVLYDNLVLDDVKGSLKIIDQKAVFSNTSAKMFKGSIGFDGTVDTKPAVSNFDMNMQIKEFDIVSSFSALDMLQKIAPFMSVFDGNMSTGLKVKGNLDNDMFPDTKTLSGNALANLLVNKVDTKKSKALSLMDEKLSFLDFTKLDLKKITTSITFENQKVVFKPFKIANYEGIPINMEGSHSFSNEMDYKLSLNLPAKYLGSQAAGFLSKMSATDVENITVPLNIKIGGSVTKPSVVPDMKTATSELSKKMVSTQKAKVTSKLMDVINKQPADSTKASPKEELKKSATKILKGLFK